MARDLSGEDVLEPSGPSGVPAAIEGRLCYPAHSQSLERGLGILACFAPGSWVLGVAEIAERLGMARSTTHRYVTTLVALGYLERDEQRKYRLALRVTELGMSAASATSLREHAGDDLEELSRRTGFAVGLGVLHGSDVVVVEWLRGTRGAHDALSKLSAGVRLPAYCTALGKMLLADMPPANRRSLTDELVLERRGPGALRSKAALLRELVQIGKAGLAVADEEFAEGLYAIAAPVRAHSRETVAAVGIAVRASAISLGDLIDALGPHLISTADRISARLGHRRDHELPGQA